MNLDAPDHYHDCSKSRGSALLPDTHHEWLWLPMDQSSKPSTRISSDYLLLMALVQDLVISLRVGGGGVRGWQLDLKETHLFLKTNSNLK